MAGVDMEYDEVNYFYSNIFDLTLSGWGEGKHLDRRILRGTQGLRGELAERVLAKRMLEGFRPQQAADVIHALTRYAHTR